MAVLGVRSLVLGFGGDSESVIVGLHRKCGWGGGAQELILKMQMKRYQCDIVITVFEERNQSSRAEGMTQRFTHAVLGR